jgi:hypothetical protein
MLRRGSPSIDELVVSPWVLSGNVGHLPSFLIMAACAEQYVRGSSVIQVSIQKTQQQEMASHNSLEATYCVDKDLVRRDERRVGLVEEGDGHLRAAIWLVRAGT